MTVMQGEIIPSTPSAVASPQQAGAHAVAAVLRDLVHWCQHYASEGEKLAAMNAIDLWEKANVPASAAVNRENDRAATEDVTKRIPPNSANAVVPAGPAINYDLLAAALVRAQAQQAGGGQ